jgi:transcriptional regulator with XRE-family HTH domain
MATTNEGGTMVRVRGDNVQALREHQRLSERQTAIGIAERLNENPGTWRHAIRRIERRELSELSEDEAAALAEELGVDVEHLGERLLWTWSTDDGFPWDIGTKALAFTDPGSAFDRRARLTGEVPDQVDSCCATAP